MHPGHINIIEPWYIAGRPAFRRIRGQIRITPILLWAMVDSESHLVDSESLLGNGVKLKAGLGSFQAPVRISNREACGLEQGTEKNTSFRQIAGNRRDGIS